MKRLLLLLFVCCTAFSCEQNDVIDTKVKIAKKVLDGVYIENINEWRILKYQNGDLVDWWGAPGVTPKPTDRYILLENNIPYAYYDEKCAWCDARLVWQADNIIFDIKNKFWGQETYDYNIIKYTEDNITLIETEQHARERSRYDDSWTRIYFVYERVDDNGDLFQKLKAAKSYTPEEYRKWWKENGCEHCGYYIE